MFGFFNKRKKTAVEKSIDKDGVEHVARVISDTLLSKMPKREIAYQFILEELDAASKGGDVAIYFAKNSGISPVEYKGALNNSMPEVDGEDGPQQLLVKICSNLLSNPEMMMDLRIRVDENIMKAWSFGKYTSKISFATDGIRLGHVGVDVLFIVKNDDVIYINNNAGHLFKKEEYDAVELKGRVVNIVFEDQLNGTKIEFFVAFNESDAYSLFTLRDGMRERLDSVSNFIFTYPEFGSLFSFSESYATQYLYTFKLYGKDDKFFMINNSQSEAYLISGDKIERENVDEIKANFWDASLSDEMSANANKKRQPSQNATFIKAGYSSDTRFYPGQRLHHAVFGEGEVAAVEGNPSDPVIDVRFDQAGRRRLIASRAPIKLL